MTRESFEKSLSVGYRDRFGFPVGKRGQQDPDGNCLMFLAEEMIIRRDLLGSADEAAEDVERFLELADLCQLEVGNFRRTPAGAAFSTDQEGWDDFLGLTAAATVLGEELVLSFQLTQLIAQIVLFGRRHFFRWAFLRFAYCYPTSSPAPAEIKDPTPWFGRYLQFVAHLRWCAAETPNLLQRFVWCWSVAFAGWSEPQGQDPWRLTYLMVRAQKTRQHWWQPENVAEQIWRWRLLRAWPGGIGAVRGRYFNDPQHPLATFASMDF
jgi:hypothetical protein